MYLWDANILRHFAEGNPILKAHLERIDWPQIALPSIVVAEVLRGRCEFALKATPTQAPQAHQRLLDTMAMLQAFDIAPFDEECARIVLDIQKRGSTRKRYADVMIAAIAIARGKILVTRNQRHFIDLLPSNQIVNWIDDRPR
jgi:predicted nucleic acid-binding protein